MTRYIPTLACAALSLFCFVMWSRARRDAAETEPSYPTYKKLKRREKTDLALLVLTLWLLVGCIITLIFGTAPAEKFTVDVIPPRSGLSIFGYQPSETMLVGWGIMAVLIAAAVLLRIFFIPRLSDTPGKLQNVLETLVEAVEGYASQRTDPMGRPMFGFIFAMGAILLGNAVAELMGFRSPSSDLMFTVALALMSFLMANWYGIRKLSVKGRLKGLMHPSPLLLPIRLVTDLANPLSMACRLFGNTVSGMIVMTLLYSVLGSYGSLIPSIVGLYFNVFTALIQTVIFITLTLASVHDATTPPET